MMPAKTGYLDCSGTFRVYFNRHGAAPMVWCVSPVDGDSWEIAVRCVHMCDVTVHSRYEPKETADEDDGKPSAWFEVTGELRVDPYGIAHFKPAVSEEA